MSIDCFITVLLLLLQPAHFVCCWCAFPNQRAKASSSPSPPQHPLRKSSEPFGNRYKFSLSSKIYIHWAIPIYCRHQHRHRGCAAYAPQHIEELMRRQCPVIMRLGISFVLVLVSDSCTAFENFSDRSVGPSSLLLLSLLSFCRCYVPSTASVPSLTLCRGWWWWGATAHTLHRGRLTTRSQPASQPPTGFVKKLRYNIDSSLRKWAS